MFSQGEAERLLFQKIGGDRDTAEHLQTHGHKKAAEPAERSCSDQIPYSDQ